MNKENMLAAYSDFTKWCRDNPHLDLDSRLHDHGGSMGDGGYISHEKTRIAFAAWRAAIEADRKRRGEPVVYPVASPEDAAKGWTLDYRFIEQVERAASQRTDYTTSMEAAEQVLIAANEVLRAPQPAEPVKVRPETDSEHIARDIREGRFPDKSDRKMVPAEPVI